MLFREVITVYSENHMKSINALCRQNSELIIIKSGGTYSYYWLKGLNVYRYIQGCSQEILSSGVMWT
jgi:hypothetical protein